VLLDMGPSKQVICLFMMEVTLDQTLGNWYHFIKPTNRIKDLQTMKQLLNAVSYFIVIIFPSGLCKRLF
jgi:hypothetical protein